MVYLIYTTFRELTMDMSNMSQTFRESLNRNDILTNPVLSGHRLVYN
jgi:hypothetical protein